MSLLLSLNLSFPFANVIIIVLTVLYVNTLLCGLNETISVKNKAPRIVWVIQISLNKKSSQPCPQVAFQLLPSQSDHPTPPPLTYPGILYLESMEQNVTSLTLVIKILPLNFQVHYFGKDDLNFHLILQDSRHMLGFQ